MSPERWQQVERIFHAAPNLRSEERADFVARECGDDDELRREVEALLAYEEQAEDFIEKPILQAAAEHLAENRTPEFSAGGRLGNHHILSLLGKGGMGEVYLARDLKLGREVAIKILPAEFARDPDRLARFEREARLLAQLKHPNIAAIHALEEDGETRFIVLEYVPGETLAERLQSGPLPPSEALPLLEQIAAALAAAHEQGIVHRDLKPANIKVTPQGQVKVLDFGLAKISRHDLPTAELSAAMSTASRTLTTMTAEGLILGTVPYMSPEQTRGLTIDRCTDLWAFGCVCYEMLAGARPFGGATTADTLAAILGSEPNWRALPKQTPDAIVTLIRRCLLKDHLRRLNDAGEARRLIAQARSEDSPLAARLRRARRSARLALAVAAVFIVLASLVTWQVTRHGARPDDLATMLAPKLKGENLNWALARLSSHASAASEDEEPNALDEVGNLRAINETIDTLKVRTAKEPQSARLHAMLSQAYYLKYSLTLDNNDKEDAVRACEQALRLGENFPEVQIALGNLLIGLGRPEQAAARFNVALAANPQDYDAVLGLARVYEDTDRAAEAENLYLRAVSLRSDDWSAYNELGGFYFARGRYEDAAREWRRVTEKSPLNAVVLNNLGNAYYYLGETGRAEESYRQSLSVRPTAAAYVGLGMVLYDRGDYAGAAQEFEKATARTPQRPDVWANYADACRVAGRVDQAAAAYDRAIELSRARLEANPRETATLTLLAECLAKRGEKREALAKIEESLKADRAASLASAVVVYYLSGRRSEALNALAEALSAGLSVRDFERNPELAGLRRDPDYERIVGPPRRN